MKVTIEFDDKKAVEVKEQSNAIIARCLYRTLKGECLMLDERNVITFTDKETRETIRVESENDSPVFGE